MAPTVTTSRLRSFEDNFIIENGFEVEPALNSIRKHGFFLIKTKHDWTRFSSSISEYFGKDEKVKLQIGGKDRYGGSAVVNGEVIRYNSRDEVKNLQTLLVTPDFIEDLELNHPYLKRDLQDIWEKCVADAKSTAKILSQLFAIDNVTENTLLSLSNSPFLRLNKYEGISEPSLNNSSTSIKTNLYAHVDPNSFILVYADEEELSLQVQSNEDGEWRSVSVKRGYVAVLLGTAIQMIAPGKLAPSRHRVLRSSKNRISANFCVMPDDNTLPEVDQEIAVATNESNQQVCLVDYKSMNLPMPPPVSMRTKDEDTIQLHGGLLSPPSPEPSHVARDSVSLVSPSPPATCCLGDESKNVPINVTADDVISHWRLLDQVVCSGNVSAPKRDFHDKEYWETQIQLYEKYMSLRNKYAAHSIPSATADVTRAITIMSEINEFPDPPFEVYYLWLVHMLQPAAYREDCLLAFGRILPHVNHSPCLQNDEYLNSLWLKEYGTSINASSGHGTENSDSKESIPMRLFQAVDWWKGLDGLTAIHRDIQCNVPAIPAGDHNFIERALHHYETYLHLAVSSKEELAPGFAIDFVWHSHQCTPVQYSDYMSLLGDGTFINHNPCGELNPFQPQWMVSTEQAWSKMCAGASPDRDILPPYDCRFSHCCADNVIRERLKVDQIKIQVFQIDR